LSRWPRRFARLISADVVQPRPTKWADPKEPHPAPGLNEPSVGARPEARGLQENKRPLLGRTRFEPISTADGRQPFVPAGVCNAGLFELSLRFPFFEAERPPVGASKARRYPAMGENITRT
jgi:hypothetical protein